MRQGKNIRTQNRRKKMAAVIAGASVLTAFFLYRTGQLYLEKRALAEEVLQWHQDADGNREQSAVDRIEYQGKIYRRNTYVKAILCMGIDRPGSLKETMVAGSGGQADAIFLVAQDVARDKVEILMIPRDTMTEITLTDLSGNVLGRDIQHLALGYAYGDGRDKSCQYMKEAVSNLLGGLAIDGYMAISMSALPIINDGVGGVTVTVKEQGMERVDSEFIYGQTVTLKGRQAEKYIRCRDTGQAQSALGRAERQKSYIEGLLQAAKIKSGKDDSFVSGLLKEMEPYMVTDMTKDRYLDMALAFLGGNQDLGESDMMTLPGKAVETPIYDEYHPDKSQIRPIILDMFYREETADTDIGK